MKIASRFRHLRPKKMFHCPVTEPQNVFHCPATRVSFHGSSDNEMCLIVRYSTSVPRTCSTIFELSKRLPYFYEAEHRRFRHFAQEQSAIVLASMLACHAFSGERRVSSRRYSVLLLLTPNKYRPADTDRSPKSPSKKGACQLTGNRALLPA